jgi:basic amino acid/polyamine antiporter, APA family
MQNENPATNSFQRSLTLTDATLLVIGSMIGSGIFIVSADILRNVGTAQNLLLVWLITGLMTMTAALSYVELIAMFPKAGGQYVYLREAFNAMVGFLYGWALFAVIQTGTIAAVGMAFAKFGAYIFPFMSEKNYLLGNASSGFKLSGGQVVAVLVILLLTYINTRGVQSGKWVQNSLTVIKFAAMGALIIFGFTASIDPAIWANNWANDGGMFALKMVNNSIESTPLHGAWGIFAAIAVASIGSIFSSFAWENVASIAEEVKRPERNIPLALLLGTALVMTIYMLMNVMYLKVLPLGKIAFAENDRVAVEAAKALFGTLGTTLIAIMIMISTFSCINGLALAGARVYYMMAKDGLFFQQAAELNVHGVPAKSLWLQGIWSCMLCFSGKYGDLLDYVSFAIVLFYGLTIAGVIVLRFTRPEIPRPYKAIGYPVIPILYILLCAGMLIALLICKPEFTWPGLGIVLMGIPLYYWVVKGKSAATE